MHRPRTLPRGFTLSELLVAIAIVAVLAAIFFPVLVQARERARQVSCLANEREIGRAIAQYTADYDERFPSGIVPAGVREFWSGEGWAGQCAGYLRSPALLRCPDDPTPPAAPHDFVVSYGYNINLVEPADAARASASEDEDEGPGYFEGAPPPGRTLSALTSPARTVLAFEVAGVTAEVGDAREGSGPGGTPGRYFSASANGLDNRLYAHRTAETAPDNLYATGYLGGRPPAAPSQFGAGVGRHGGGADFLLADGHARWLRGGQVSAGLNAVREDCPQDDEPPRAGCATDPDEEHAAGTQAGGAPADATFSAE